MMESASKVWGHFPRHMLPDHMLGCSRDDVEDSGLTLPLVAKSDCEVFTTRMLELESARNRSDAPTFGL